MADLLESVQTIDFKSHSTSTCQALSQGTLRQGYLATLNQGTQVTGNKQTNDIDASTSTSDNVVDIRRLAGLK